MKTLSFLLVFLVCLPGSADAYKLYTKINGVAGETISLSRGYIQYPSTATKVKINICADIEAGKALETLPANTATQAFNPAGVSGRTFPVAIQWKLASNVFPSSHVNPQYKTYGKPLPGKTILSKSGFGGEYCSPTFTVSYWDFSHENVYYSMTAGTHLLAQTHIYSDPAVTLQIAVDPYSAGKSGAPSKSWSGPAPSTLSHGLQGKVYPAAPQQSGQGAGASGAGNVFSAPTGKPPLGATSRSPARLVQPPHAKLKSPSAHGGSAISPTLNPQPEVPSVRGGSVISPALNPQPEVPSAKAPAIVSPSPRLPGLPPQGGGPAPVPKPSQEQP